MYSCYWLMRPDSSTVRIWSWSLSHSNWQGNGQWSRWASSIGTCCSSAEMEEDVSGIGKSRPHLVKLILDDSWYSYFCAHFNPPKHPIFCAGRRRTWAVWLHSKARRRSSLTSVPNMCPYVPMESHGYVPNSTAFDCANFRLNPDIWICVIVSIIYCLLRGSDRFCWINKLEAVVTALQLASTDDDVEVRDWIEGSRLGNVGDWLTGSVGLL